MSHYGPVYRNNYRSIDTKGRWLAGWLAGWLTGECFIAGYTHPAIVCVVGAWLLFLALHPLLSLFFSGDLFTIQRTSHREPRKKDRKVKRERERERERKREEKGSGASQSVDGGRCSALERQIVCLSGASGARTNKWKQIISWPHYANESMERARRARG